MSKITAVNSKPELKVRATLHKMGYRFRLHRKNLPGNPDIVLPKYKLVIFVHGCFWHRHENCKYAYTPKSNLLFWTQKFRQNVERDQKVEMEYRRSAWRSIIIWECETRNEVDLAAILQRQIAR